MSYRLRLARALFVVAMGLGIVLWLFSFQVSDSEVSRRFQSDVATARGTEEDPRARERYEWMRLHSPRIGRIPEGIRQREQAFAETLPKRMAKNGGWQNRGPASVGGRTRALAVDVSDESKILAGGVSGGIWRSTDGGSSWTKTTGSNQLHSVTWLEQDPRAGHRDTWYAGTGEFKGNSADGGGGAFFRGDGIFKSTDGGQSWTLLASTSTGDPHETDQLFDFVWKVAVDPSNGGQDEVYAATLGAVYRSTDGGNSWNAVLHGLGVGMPFPRFTDVVVSKGGVVYAALENNGNGGTKGIWRSPDGMNWNRITPGAWPNDYDRVVLALGPPTGDPAEANVWALAKADSGAADTGPNGHVLWHYDDTVDRWNDFTDHLPERGGQTGTFNSQEGYDLIVAAHPDNSDLVFVGGRNLWRIDTAAPAGDPATWIGGYTHLNNSFAWYDPSGSDRHHPDQHAIEFLPSNGDVMYVGSDGGVHRTDNNVAGETGSSGDGAVSWTSLNSGYRTTQFYAVCFNPDDSDPTIAGGMQDNGSWSTRSTSPSGWGQEMGGDGGYCAIRNKSSEDGTYRYVSIQKGEVFRRSYDEHGNFQSETRIDPDGASDQLFINPFVLEPPASPDVMFYPADSTMWRTTDAGSVSRTSGWTELTGISNNTTDDISALDVSRAGDSPVLYYGTSMGHVYRLNNADSAAAATTPSDVTDGSFPNDAYVSDVTVDPTDAGKVLVTFSNYEVKSIFYTSDGGISWTDVSGDLEEFSSGAGDGPSVRSAAILPQPGLDPSQTTYYVGTSTGLYSTTELNGTSTTWTQEGPNVIEQVVVDQVRAREIDGLVLAGTHANGVYSFDAPGTVEPPVSENVLALSDGAPCAKLKDRSLKCWGANGQGQLGLGDTENRGDEPGEMGNALPTVDLGTDPEGNRLTVRQMTGGNTHKCALLENGTVKCWGGVNSSGELGLGDRETRGDEPGEMGDNLPAVDLGTGRTATQVAAGADHSCALLDNGRVKCWGDNYFGQLGLGDTENRGDEPGEMGDNLPSVNLGTDDDGEERTVTHVSAGENEACALLDTGEVKCWGENDAGELGLGDLYSRGDEPGEMGDNLPTVDLGTGRTATQVVTGNESACALLDSGAVKCWGANGRGTLGLGDTEARGDEPGEMGDNLPPVNLGTGRTAKQIVPNFCALLDNGRVKCWGPNSRGQHGLGDFEPRGDEPGEMGDNLPPVNLGTGRTARQIDRAFPNVCALLDNDTIKCWGAGAGGQLGLGDTEARGDEPGEMGDNLPPVNLGDRPLPVELARFEARLEEEAAVLRWRTASEMNNAGFEVQRRAAGEEEAKWKEVDFVESKAPGGMTEEPKRYRFEDSGLPFAADRLEYRLRQVDTDGTASLTDPVEVERTVEALQLRKTFPNPAHAQATVQFAVPETRDVSLELYDVLGRQVRTVRQGEVQGRQELQIGLSGLASGTYFLRLRAEGETQTQRLTVVR